MKQRSQLKSPAEAVALVASRKHAHIPQYYRKRLGFITVLINAIFFIHVVYSYYKNDLYSSIIAGINYDSPINGTTEIDRTNTQIMHQPNSQIITKRGGGFLTTHTGCHISKWLYSQERGTLPLFKECKAQPPNRQLHRVNQIQENDTLFVPFTAMQQFVDEVLDELSCNIVIISGQTHIVPTIPDETLHELLNHTHVTHWFAHNLPIYGGSDPYHPKISPFPYGLKETEANGKLMFESYKQVFFESMRFNETAIPKTKFVYAGPLGMSQPGRRTIPQTPKKLIPHEEYFANMAKSRYVLSPNGDRPDCYRHYEAIGLGTVPVTELDPVLFRHLAEGPAVYDTKDWRLRSLYARLDPNPRVNRNLIWEDYWMDWVEKEVGMELNWRIFENPTTGN